MTDKTDTLTAGQLLRERAALFLGRASFIALLAVIVLAVVPYGTVDAWWQAVFECTIFTITAVWLVHVMLVGKWQLRQSLVVLPLALITVFAFAQTAVWPEFLAHSVTKLSTQRTLTIDRYQTYLTARKALALTLFLQLLLVHTSSMRRLRWLTRVTIGLGLVSAVFAILRQLLQSPDSQTGFVLPFLFYGVGYGEFMYHNAFAYLMEMTIAVLTGLVVGGAVRKERIPLYLAGIIPVFTALVLSESRGGVLSLICQYIFLLFVALSWYSQRQLEAGNDRGGFLTFVHKSKLVRALALVLIVGTLIVGVLWTGGERFASRVREMDTEELINRTSRQSTWRSTLEIISHNPWTGAGFGTFFLSITEFQRGAGTIKLEQAHQDYLDLAANGGVVAVILAGWFVFMIGRSAKSTMQSRDPFRRALALGAAAGLISLCAHSLVDFCLQITGLAVCCGALVVIAIAPVSERPRSASRRLSTANSDRLVEAPPFETPDSKAWLN